MTWRSRGVAVVVLAVVAAAGWTAQTNGLGSRQNAPVEAKVREPLAVEVRRIHPVDHVTRQREFTGIIKAARVSQLGFERPGRVVSIAVDEGQAVEQGQILASIDVENVAAQLAVVKAQLEQAQAVLAELVEGPRKETIAAARANVAGLEANVNRLHREFERASQLVRNNSITREQFEAAKFQLAAAVAERDALQKQLEELLAGTRTEKLDAQRAVIKKLEAEVQSLLLDLDDGELRAPFAGRIAERYVDEGTVVNSGMQVFQLVEDSQLEAWVGIPPSVAEQLSLATIHEVTVAEKTVRVSISSLRPQLDLVTRTQNLILKIESDDIGGLVPGQIVRLSIAEQIPARGYLLPASALVPGLRGLWNVFVVDDSETPTIQQRDVELLYTLGEQSLVRGTLEDGEAVVVDGIHRIVAGQKVVAVEREKEEI